MSQFAHLVSSILSIAPSTTLTFTLMVSFLSSFFITNQPHAQQHQEPMQGINSTYVVCVLFYFILSFYSTNVY